MDCDYFSKRSCVGNNTRSSRNRAIEPRYNSFSGGFEGDARVWRVHPHQRFRSLHRPTFNVADVVFR